MANPQVENGHTKIANELYEASFRVRIPIYDYIIWHCILRNTYGYHKKENWVSLSRISEMTGIQISNVARSKRNLLNNNMIITKDTNVGIQKDYTRWKCKMATTISTDTIPTDTVPKDTISRDTIPTDNKIISRDNKKISRDNKTVSVEIDNKDNKDNIKENLKGEQQIISDIYKTFEDNYQKLTQEVSSQLNDLIDTYTADKVLKAIKGGVKYNGRNLAYIEAILKDKGNGNKPAVNKTMSVAEFLKSRGIDA